MLISPPFLPARGATETEDAWIERCMSGGLPGQGAFPVSFNLGWHGGMHLTAPTNGTQWEPVRAIADGEVVFVRQATQMPAGPLSPTDPQAYGGSWTDNGVVVIRHTTEIGEGADAAVTFFSITMHLNHIEAAIQPRQRVYRKAALGTAGRIAGRSVGEAFLHTVHLEIVCDEDNVARLAGRARADLSTASDGRTNAVFGEMYFHLPSGAQVFGQLPLPDSAQAMMQPPTPHGQRAPATQPLQPIHTTNEELIIGLRYAGGEGAAGHRGDAAITTYRPDGSEVGAALTEADAEYTLYTTATAISEAYPAATRPAPSAVFELLRFGRVIGPDALAPADVPHWRQVRHAGGQGWVNLNADNVHKFSDADFPHWKRWSFVDDSADGDSRCDSAVIRGWLDSDGNGTVTTAEAQSRMADDAVAPKLAHAICKFPTEWDAATIDARWGWLKTQSDENPLPLSNEDFEALRRHITALTFWPGGLSIDANHWHWQPREFIRQFRRCGWLSSADLERSLAAAPAAGRARALALGVAMNEMMRKYAVSVSRLREAHFMAQVGHETGWWQYREELGNERYFRTMYEIISSQEAAEDYRSGLARRLGQIRRGETEQAYAARRPGAVAAKAAGMDNGAANASDGGRVGDGPRFRGRGFLQITGRRNYTGYGSYRGRDFTTDPNPRLLASDDFSSCDASGFYWARERANIEADGGATARNVTRVGGIVNRGSPGSVPLHDDERQEAFSAIWGRINDAP
jgi:hydroxyethylthiazole kinase